MSYDFDLIAHSHDRKEALANLKDYLSNHGTYRKVGRQEQYEFQTGGKEDAFLLELIDETDFSMVETEDEEDPRTLAWISVNFFRSAEHYLKTAQELQTILFTKKFFLYDPQSDVYLTRNFPIKEFVAGMSALKLEEVEQFLKESGLPTGAQL